MFVSDLPLQDDERNRSRYAAHHATYGTWGIFELPDGGVVRHHDPAWLNELFAGLDPLQRELIEAPPCTATLPASCGCGRRAPRS